MAPATGQHQAAASSAKASLDQALQHIRMKSLHPLWLQQRPLQQYHLQRHCQVTLNKEACSTGPAVIKAMISSGKLAPKAPASGAVVAPAPPEQLEALDGSNASNAIIIISSSTVSIQCHQRQRPEALHAKPDLSVAVQTVWTVMITATSVSAADTGIGAAQSGSGSTQLHPPPDLIAVQQPVTTEGLPPADAVVVSASLAASAAAAAAGDSDSSKSRRGEGSGTSQRLQDHLHQRQPGRRRRADKRWQSQQRFCSCTNSKLRGSGSSDYPCRRSEHSTSTTDRNNSSNIFEGDAYSAASSCCIL